MLVCGSANAQLDRADPLEVPSGPLPVPEQGADLPFGERLQEAEMALRERGFRELPILAWAALDAAKDGTRPNFIEKALRLAPRTPGVLYEVGRQRGDAGAFPKAAFALLKSFPGLLWLLSTFGVALGVSVLMVTTLMVMVGYGRTIALHGHALGHFTDSIEPPSWPGILLGIGTLALMPLFGMGPLIILAVAGFLAALRLPIRASLAVAMSIAVLGLCAGPLLDGWAKISAVQGQRDTLLAVWRVDRGQPLPGDEARLKLATTLNGDDLLARIGLATLFKRRGDLEATEDLLADIPAAAAPGLRSHAFNILGSVHLARGDLKEAVEWLEDARAAEESAAVLYNLSQAYGRALRLEDHSALFVAARERDPALIREHTQVGGTSLHSYLIQPPIPLSLFLAEAFVSTAPAGDVARKVRAWTLGRRAPAWSWLVLPILGVFGLALRLKGISRCERCGKTICNVCSPGAEMNTCVTCERLLSSAGSSDPRLRRAQLDLDRARRKRVTLGLFGSGILIPGLPALFEGRIAGGCTGIAAVGAGVAMLLIHSRVPGPWEIGDLGHALPAIFGYGLLVPAYALGVWGSFTRLRRWGLAS
jgi:tetratricopeptide (TPR) repeat protein